MINNFLLGFAFFIQGLKLIFRPGLKRYLIVPIIINAFIMFGILAGLSLYLSHHVSHFTADYPRWIAFIIGILFWIVYSLLSLLVGTFVFTILTNIIASPFYGLLADATAMALQQRANDSPTPETTLSSVLLLVPRTLVREGRKLLYFLPWLLLCLLLVIIPFAWPLLPFVWWAVLSWILAIQYSDYQPDNDWVTFKKTLTILKHHSLMVFGFGNAICIAMLIPGANLFVPPAAVAGGTALWLRIRERA